MHPSSHTNHALDHLTLAQIGYHGQQPKRGDYTIFQNPPHLRVGFAYKDHFDHPQKALQKSSNDLDVTPKQVRSCRHQDFFYRLPY